MMFDANAFIAEQTEDVRKSVPGKVIIACSGGVDSTAAAVLASRALGDRLLAVYIDTGLMRKGETEDVAQTLKELSVRHQIVHAADEFFAALRGIVDPEKKRSIIGRKFIELFEREAKTFGADHLVQGTIAPDWIESGGQLRDRIKTHHNVGGLPENMKLKLVEPLRDLYKDEVRAVARALGVRVSERQPFPGPGLAGGGAPVRQGILFLVGPVRESHARLRRRQRGPVDAPRVAGPEVPRRRDEDCRERHPGFGAGRPGRARAVRRRPPGRGGSGKDGR